MTNTYRLFRNTVEEVHVREVFTVEANSLEEAKELVNKNEVNSIGRDCYFDMTIKATDAEEEVL